MKIRNGFVSNSSASSFTIYGWTEKELFAQVAALFPILKGVELYAEEYTIEENIAKAYGGSEYDVTSCRNSKGNQVFGVGSSGIEIDHYHNGPGSWEDFKYPEPDELKRERIEELALKWGLAKPTMHQETFYEG